MAVESSTIRIFFTEPASIQNTPSRRKQVQRHSSQSVSQSANALNRMKPGRLAPAERKTASGRFASAHFRRLNVRFSLAQFHLILNGIETPNNFIQPQRCGVNGAHLFPAIVRQGLIGEQNQIRVSKKRGDGIDHSGARIQ
jgi:hypothetical protein